jgi:SsrA-binding protein
MAPTIHNHKAGRDYFILETIEAGLELKGTEVKSLRQAGAAIDEAFARIEDGEVWLYNAHISPYEFGNRYNVEPARTRRLLLHRREIIRLSARIAAKGMTLVPLKIYFKEGLAKILLAVGKGKSRVDKREVLKRQTADREIERALSRSRRSTG